MDFDDFRSQALGHLWQRGDVTMGPAIRTPGPIIIGIKALLCIPAAIAPRPD
jgi:hypothetical protein